MRGIFTISLDFELHWGGFEKWPLLIPNSKSQVQVLTSYNQYFLNTRHVIPQMLALFSKYDIHVTWASVGMLLHSTREELLKNAPELRPTYSVANLSAYEYIQKSGIGENEEEDPFHFAPSLVRQIVQTRNQELATHSYSHFYCNEPGQTVEQFREDLQAAKRVTASFGATLRSLVFPRNQFNDEYLRVCYEEGIRCVRSNPSDWFWDIKSTQHESMWKRLNRGADAYLPIGKRNTYNLDKIPVRSGFPFCLPASRLLRPYQPRELFLNGLKISRIKSEMFQAAQSGEVYHLWWHPHNFGRYPVESLMALETILQYFSYCRDSLNMQSCSMGETAEIIARDNGKTQAA